MISKALQPCLRDEHAVERVAVQQRKPRGLDRVTGRHRQLEKAVGLERAEEVVAHGEFADQRP